MQYALHQNVWKMVINLSALTDSKCFKVIHFQFHYKKNLNHREYMIFMWNILKFKNVMEKSVNNLTWYEQYCNSAAFWLFSCFVWTKCNIFKHNVSERCGCFIRHPVTIPKKSIKYWIELHYQKKLILASCLHKATKFIIMSILFIFVYSFFQAQ